MKKFTCLVSSFLFFTTLCAEVQIEIQPFDIKTQNIAINLSLDESELLYKHSIAISVDSPYIELTDLQENRNPTEKYDPTTKETRLVFDEDFTINLQAHQLNDKPVNASLHVTYQTNNDPYPRTTLFPLTFNYNLGNQLEKSENNDNQPAVTLKLKNYNESLFDRVYNKIQSWSKNLSTVVQQTKSLPIRLLFVFLLGILLSFTPCIYPMIPITVGILQAQKSSSVIGNFSRSFAYTLGLSMTFACFGLAASITGPIYGKLLMSPISVGILVFILGFLGLSMFGLYDVQLPKFLQLKQEASSGGSLLSSFIFGAASGTIASPCVSPGLILLLSIVATMGNLFLGFLLLFSFGFGLSVPLLLIGTFSSSMNMMPRAGMWMVEIKKFFGIMLFGVCFYYLNNILPQTTLRYLVSFSLLFLGLYYFFCANKTTSPGIKQFSNGFGFVLLCFCVVSFGYTLQTQYLSPSVSNDSHFWITDYQHALKKARAEHTLLFLDFWAEYCSICKAINKKISNSNAIQEAFQKVVPVKINGTYDEEPFKSLKQQFNIVGFPTFLLIDPTTNTVLKKWHSELYTMDEKVFIDELMQEVK